MTEECKDVEPTPVAPPAPAGDLADGMARAHWLMKDLLLWRLSDATKIASKFEMRSSKTASLKDGKSPADEIVPITLETDEMSLELGLQYPYLKGCSVFKVPDAAKAMLTHQVSVVASDADGEVLDCTGVQVGSVLDDLYSYSGALGCVPAKDGGVSLHLWAPTAQEVSVALFSQPTGSEPKEVLPMTFQDGVWSSSGPKGWWGLYYVYKIKAYHPQTSKIENMETPDPYSIACSADSERSFIAYLPTWDEVAPGGSAEGFRKHVAPAFEDRSNASVYELHVRDFSMSDDRVPKEYKGKYLAFEIENTHGDRHLRALAAAGLSHVQLLPTYDFGSVPEREEDRLEPDLPDSPSHPACEDPQKKIAEVQDRDGFNWGYDPVLYNVPEGSYATNPDGGQRILEHRRMVKALHEKGLRVVVDVVYNHTLGSGPNGPHSVLDKCVPGYYHRRSEHGHYENSTCMNNTAGERAMMRRLILDSVLMWAKEYRVDGFRFDLMGHIPLDCMKACRAALDALTVEANGFDGQKVLMYGEGWEFGEIHGGQRGPVAIQWNLGGTHIGSFNDRLRDAAVGGSPFADPRLQGFATGLLLRTNPEDVGQGDEGQQRNEVLLAADKLRISMMGSLRHYVLPQTCFGDENMAGGDIHGGGVGYTCNPEEIINYVSAHDNETLFDNTVWKMPPSLFTVDERLRANWLCTSIVALSQGIPFFHAGDELLRSKSMDRDSYNSGDWFNSLDFSGCTTGFGRGLPVQSKNGEKWELLKPLLQEEGVAPTKAHIDATITKFLELLRIRASSKLFRLSRAEDIKTYVSFPHAGPEQMPGVVCMQILNGPSTTGSGMLCKSYARVIVVISSHFDTIRLPVPQVPEGSCAGRIALQLHPEQEKSADSVVKTATVEGEDMVIPRQSAIVFVEHLAN